MHCRDIWSKSCVGILLQPERESLRFIMWGAEICAPNSPLGINRIAIPKLSSRQRPSFVMPLGMFRPAKHA